MPVGISQRRGRILIVNATKRIKIKADMEIIVAWLRLGRNRPRFLNLSVMRSLDNVSLIPNLSHLFIVVNGVFYLILRFGC